MRHSLYVYSLFSLLYLWCFSSSFHLLVVLFTSFSLLSTLSNFLYPFGSQSQALRALNTPSYHQVHHQFFLDIVIYFTFLFIFARFFVHVIVRIIFLSNTKSKLTSFIVSVIVSRALYWSTCSNVYGSILIFPVIFVTKG